MLKLLSSIFSLIALVVVIVWGVRLFDSYYRAQNYYHTLKEQYYAKQNELNKLKAEMVKKTDPYEVEKTIRNNLGLAKQGETVVVVSENNIKDVVASATGQLKQRVEGQVAGVQSPSGILSTIISLWNNLFK